MLSSCHLEAAQVEEETVPLAYGLFCGLRRAIDPTSYGDLIMRYKMLALILALTVMSWAQTATQTTSSTPQQSTHPADKPKSCDKMAPSDSKDAPACCAHHNMQSNDGKETASCCAGKHSMSGAKGAMSCMRNGKHENASCCKDGCGKKGCSKDCCAKDKTASACCNGKDRKSCCSGKKAEKTAKNCRREELHS